MGLISRLKSGLSKTRQQISTIVGGDEQFDETFFETLEDALVSADIGLDLSTEILDRLQDTIKADSIKTTGEAYSILKQILVDDLRVEENLDDFPPRPWVVLVIGVNGVGKTTTVGKLAKECRDEGKRVMFGAVDTFRAGAIEQLKIWADRTGSDFISQHEGADPASVAYDALEAAKSRNVDVLILDTAGRLHNKKNLMNELEKIVRVLKRNTPHTPNEVLLVVDATIGQNAIKQTEVFSSILGLTGLVITKLDGTAKGGIALALTKKFNIPIRKIGVGEGVSDLQDFDPETYVDAMFGDLDT
jgi:fused signal recognition particle receptor